MNLSTIPIKPSILMPPTYTRDNLYCDVGGNWRHTVTGRTCKLHTAPEFRFVSGFLEQRFFSMNLLIRQCLVQNHTVHKTIKGSTG